MFDLTFVANTRVTYLLLVCVTNGSALYCQCFVGVVQLLGRVSSCQLRRAGRRWAGRLLSLHSGNFLFGIRPSSLQHTHSDSLAARPDLVITISDVITDNLSYHVSTTACRHHVTHVAASLTFTCRTYADRELAFVPVPVQLRLRKSIENCQTDHLLFSTSFMLSTQSA